MTLEFLLVGHLVGLEPVNRILNSIEDGRLVLVTDLAAKFLLRSRRGAPIPTALRSH